MRRGGAHLVDRDVGREGADAETADETAHHELHPRVGLARCHLDDEADRYDDRG
jgi:hypothetical protein